jgi:hypothetical protein
MSCATLAATQTATPYDVQTSIESSLSQSIHCCTRSRCQDPTRHIRLGRPFVDQSHDPCLRCILWRLGPVSLVELSSDWAVGLVGEAAAKGFYEVKTIHLVSRVLVSIDRNPRKAADESFRRLVVSSFRPVVLHKDARSPDSPSMHMSGLLVTRQLAVFAPGRILWRGVECVLV